MVVLERKLPSGTERSDLEVRPLIPAHAMNVVNDDSPWDADPNPSYAHQSEWSKITSDFSNVRGYSGNQIYS